MKEFMMLMQSSTNFSSKNFVGFPDAGNSIAANLASLLSTCMNQNMINETFCSPKATFIEMETISWLRELIGYIGPKTFSSAADAGGAAVIGGVHANTIALLAAREKLFPGCLRKGLAHFDTSRVRILTPASINHYSIRCALAWLGLGEESLVEVPIGRDYKYDLQALENTISSAQENKEQILAVIAYAGDSRTQSIDRLNQIGSLCNKYNIWFHVDACHGLQLLFSRTYRHRIQGIELADSVTLDPHKVLWIPYNLSYVLFKNPASLETIGASSDLITKERWALGQFTPFIGSKAFNSLKLWALLKHLGSERIGTLIDQRLALVQTIQTMVDSEPNLYRLNHTDINSIMFVYLPRKLRGKKTESLSEQELLYLNDLNHEIYKTLMNEKEYYVHSFKIVDAGHKLHPSIQRPVQVLRLMPGNVATTRDDIHNLLSRILEIGERLSKYFIVRGCCDQPSTQQRSEILNTLAEQVSVIMPEGDFFALVYGSCAYKENPFRSDVDVVVAIDDQQFNSSRRNDLIKIIKNIHTTYNLRIDEEISYDNKILISYSEADAAVSGAGLCVHNGRLSIPPIEKKPSYLNSHAMRLRLFHNAVTTNGIVIAGDQAKYFALREKGLRCLIWLLAHQLPRGGFHFEDLLSNLYSNGIVEGELHLGYKQNSKISHELESSLQSTFHQMVKEGFLIKFSEHYYIAQDYDLESLQRLQFTQATFQSREGT